ncbi:MAG TPA: class I SAM-dependent methyltransferase, partial [Spongiibacteraceae bacterium]|nr:class I SAM-dependent methyltransferase [Spongiibacteraceae bacterium]
HLRAISADYIGVDYVQSMVDACRGKFPDARFEYADARSMPQFADASFDLVVFAWAGICMVDHAGRLAILCEVQRVLRPGGYFIFSTYNQDGADHDAPFAFPDFSWSANPLRLAANTLNFARSTVLGLLNRQRLLRFEVRSNEYSIINDRCHDYATMLYYITFDNQLKQLVAAGFAGAVVAYDTDGNELAGETAGNSFTFIVSG